MRIKYAPNKLNSMNGYLDTKGKVTTLIGGNGSGKSSIMQSIFSQYINSDDYITICFSSGQNEGFSEIFGSHKRQNKRSSREVNEEIKSFYFDKDWIKILIFYATSLKNKGLVRRYLVENNYIEVAGDNDISTTLYFKLSLYKSYLEKITNEYTDEQNSGEFVDKLYRNTIAHRYLEKLIHKKINSEYDFLDSPRVFSGRRIKLNASETIDVFGKNINEIFTFLFYASSYYDYSINGYSAELYFNDSLEFTGLSDGEYQLLAFYAMIDLFDTPNTIFIFDEIDSHLHYKNIQNTWNSFRQIKGNVITSTHNLESIIQNNFEDIRYIEKGIVNDELKPREIITKLQTLSSQQKFETQIAGRIQNIALIDDEIDWLIFKKLVKKKLGIQAVEILNKVVPIKRTSSYNTSGEIFGKSKLLFVKDFKESNSSSSIVTKNIFLICDCDLLPKTEIRNDLQVNIHREYNSLGNFNGVNTYLLSWKRLEIENYLIYKDLLIQNNILTHLDYNRLNLDDCEDIRIFDSKSILKPLYKDPQFNENKLDELIAKIPVNEVSDDIEKMYTFICSKI